MSKDCRAEHPRLKVWCDSCSTRC